MQFEQQCFTGNLFSICDHQRWHVQCWATLHSGHVFSEQGLLLCTHFDNTGSPKWKQHHIKLSWIWAMFLYFIMPCICGHTSVRGHYIQQYFSLLTTWATFSPEQLLSPPLNTLRKTFPLIESILKAIAKESSKSEICLQLGISKVEHSNIQVCSSPFLCCAHFDIPGRTSCIISSPRTSSWKWEHQIIQRLSYFIELHTSLFFPCYFYIYFSFTGFAQILS